MMGLKPVPRKTKTHNKKVGSCGPEKGIPHLFHAVLAQPFIYVENRHRRAYRLPHYRAEGLEQQASNKHGCRNFFGSRRASSTRGHAHCALTDTARRLIKKRKPSRFSSIFFTRKGMKRTMRRIANNKTLETNIRPCHGK
jgi:hypothetical protein